MFDLDWHFRHAVECRHWWTIVLEELSGVHHVQDGICGARRPADRNYSYHPSLRHTLGFGKTSATLAGAKFGRHFRGFGRLNTVLDPKVDLPIRWRDSKGR